MAKSLHTAAHRELVSEVVALRKAAGLTQRDLAARLGREQNFVGRIETGGRRIDLVEWVMLCRARDVDPATAVSNLVASVAALVPARGAARRSKSART